MSGPLDLDNLEFDLWISQRDIANENAKHAVVIKSEFFDAAAATQRVLLDTPAATLEDLAAKLIAVTDHGAYLDLGGVEDGDLIVKEAAAIIGRTEHLEIEGREP